MNSHVDNGKMVTVKDDHPVCPVCKGKMNLKIQANTSGRNIPAFCRRCKNELLLDIDRGQCSRSPSP